MDEEKKFEYDISYAVSGTVRVRCSQDYALSFNDDWGEDNEALGFDDDTVAYALDNTIDNMHFGKLKDLDWSVREDTPVKTYTENGTTWYEALYNVTGTLATHVAMSAPIPEEYTRAWDWPEYVANTGMGNQNQAWHIHELPQADREIIEDAFFKNADVGDLLNHNAMNYPPTYRTAVIVASANTLKRSQELAQKAQVDDALHVFKTAFKHTQEQIMKLGLDRTAANKLMLTAMNEVNEKSKELAQ